MESAPSAGGALSCLGTSRAQGAIGQPVEGYGGPGLVVRAQNLVRERLKVPTEVPFGERLKGSSTQVLGVLLLPSAS